MLKARLASEFSEAGAGVRVDKGFRGSASSCEFNMAIANKWKASETPAPVFEETSMYCMLWRSAKARASSSGTTRLSTSSAFEPTRIAAASSARLFST
eukprot:scaffold170821_cov33-Tisochrysis_lutea.AAC.2